MQTTVHDPQTVWINQGDWGADSKCAVQNHSHSGAACSSSSRQLDGCATEIRLPRAWTTASDCTGRADSTGSNCRSAADQPNNNAMALLLPDNETFVQMQPVYRCGFYPAPLLARWGNSTDGGPQQFPNTTSIFGDGALGAHGGSGLSSAFSSQYYALPLAALLIHVYWPEQVSVGASAWASCCLTRPPSATH